MRVPLPRMVHGNIHEWVSLWKKMQFVRPLSVLVLHNGKKKLKYVVKNVLS